MSPLEITAPPKVNLFLHVSGRRDDGYHLLDSLIVFPTGMGDIIRIEKTSELSFSVSGPFAHHAGADEGNLALRAYRALPEDMQPPVKINLEKNIPAGAGLGGGSSDAAAVIRAMEIICGKKLPLDKRNSILLTLGADVPVCYDALPARMQGIGEIITPLTDMPPIHIALCWPGVPSYTKDVFAAWVKNFTPFLPAIPSFDTIDDLIAFLKTTGNVLSIPAQQTCPVIGDAIAQMSAQDDCLLARMSGSGSCVFGLFAKEEAAAQAANTLSALHPDWWVRSGTL